MEHNLFRHGPEGCGPDERHCKLCDGGLALCTVCGGAGGELPTECPGVKMTEEQRTLVYDELLDYRAGMWLNLPPFKEEGDEDGKTKTIEG